MYPTGFSTTVTVGGKKYKIPAGWAIKVIHGKVMIFEFDPLEAFRGKLFAMGPLPEDTGIQVNHSKTASHFPSPPATIATATPSSSAI